MLRHIWTVLCRRSTIDSDSNNISMSEIFEQLEINYQTKDNEAFKGKINVPIDYEVVTMWHKWNENKEIKAEAIVEIYNPNNEKVKDFHLKFEMSVSQRRMRTRIKIVGFEIDMAGMYVFKVKYKEINEQDFKYVAEVPVDVLLNKERAKMKN